MGTRRTDYLFYGANVGFDNVEYDDYEAEMYQEEGARFDIIYDGMCGKYAYAGKIVAKSDGYDGFEPIEVKSIPEDDEVKKKVIDCFPEASKFGLFLFTHYS